MTGIEEYGPQGSGFGPGESEGRNRRPERRRQQPADDEDAEYKLAIEASKYEAEEEDRKRRNNNADAANDDDLEKAIRLSKEEEELRRRELEESNAASLFDDTPNTTQQPQNTGFNQGYQQQGAVDWFGNPINQQQTQSTGYLNNTYSQPTGFQPQQTGFTNGFQPQQTGLDQTQYQQPSYLQQQNTIQPQQTAFDTLNNPYAQQQQNAFGNQFGQPQQQPLQAQSHPSSNHNPWATNQQSQADFQKPMPTGSNNPFAANRPQVQKPQNSAPTLSTLAEQQTATQFNQRPSYNPIANYQVPQVSPPPQKEQDPHTARLNALLASGEGMDTFGNTGELRIPAHHTAPGTFVNSAGQGASRLQMNQTGSNPFFNQQFTGQPHSQGGFAPQQQFPAHTGPAGGFGQPNNNPFGSRPPGGQAQGGSLIDL